MNFRQIVQPVGKHLRRGAVIGTVGLAVLLAPAATVRSQGDTAHKVTLNMNEYAFAVDGQPAGTPLTLKAGELTDLTLTNTGSLIHEIWWGKTTQMQDGRVDGYNEALFDKVSLAITGKQGTSDKPVEIDTLGLFEIALNPGQSMTLEFTLPATAKGTWEMGCFQPMPMPAAATLDAAATQASGPTLTPAPVVSHYNVNMKLPLIVQ